MIKALEKCSFDGKDDIDFAQIKLVAFKIDSSRPYDSKRSDSQNMACGDTSLSSYECGMSTCHCATY